MPTVVCVVVFILSVINIIINAGGDFAVTSAWVQLT